ncbi:MAG: hypothetical protein OEV64_07050, partial [Desulfobulbaceae bacterium]|nr:hypothetical protein [Desulfobulbaceae bacterium]
MFLDKRVVAVCFPRSGSHFLTNCLVSYFGDSLKYLEPYANTSNFPKPRFGSHFIGARYLNFKYFCKRGAEGRADVTRAYSFDEANFIRFHDFSSFPKRSLYMSEDGVTIERKYCLGNVTNQDNTCYLILIRHPIETIQSYYELLVHASGLPDSLESWNSFQEHALEYWKSYVDKSIINPNDHL